VCLIVERGRGDERTRGRVFGDLERGDICGRETEDVGKRGHEIEFVETQHRGRRDVRKKVKIFRVNEC